MSAPPLDLRLSFIPRTPANCLTNLSEACAALGVDAFDFYGDYGVEGSWLQKFQAEVATRLGKDEGLFVPSGVMAQSIMLKVNQAHTGRDSFVVRYNSHYLLHEQESYKHLLQMEARVIPATNDEFQLAATYDDVQPFLHNDDPNQLPAAISLELPEREIGGKCIKFDDLVRISEAARANGIAIHMDGARLWEAESYYAAEGHSLHELCALFDSVYVSFYKGLGGLSGAMLLGSSAFITDSKIWLRRFGGNLYTQLPLALSGWNGFRTFGLQAFEARRTQLQTVVAAVSAALLELEPSNVVLFDPPVPEVPLVHVHINASAEKIKQAQEIAEAKTGLRCINMVRPYKTGAGVALPDRHYFELNMGEGNIRIPVESWVTAWSAFVEAMQ